MENFTREFKAEAIVHSEESKGPQKIKIIAIHNDDKIRFEAETTNGIRCTAIFNIFSGFYYADDIYGIIES